MRTNIVVDNSSDHNKPLSICSFVRLSFVFVLFCFVFFLTTISMSNETILSVLYQDRDTREALSVLLFLFVIFSYCNFGA